MKPGKLVVLFAVLAMALAACGGGEVTEQIIESQEGVGDIEIDENDGTISLEFEDDEGQGGSAVIGGGSVPDDFPIPVPAGGEVVAMFSTDAGTTVSIEYPVGDYASLVSFYEDWANSAGGNLTTFGGDDLQSWLVALDDGSGYSVAVSDNDDVAMVALIVSEG